MHAENEWHIYCVWCTYDKYRKYTNKYHIVDTSAYLFAILPDIAKFNDPIAHVIDVNNNGIIKHLSILNGKWKKDFVFVD